MAIAEFSLAFLEVLGSSLIVGSARVRDERAVSCVTSEEELFIPTGRLQLANVELSVVSAFLAFLVLFCDLPCGVTEFLVLEKPASLNDRSLLDVLSATLRLCRPTSSVFSGPLVSDDNSAKYSELCPQDTVSFPSEVKVMLLRRVSLERSSDKEVLKVSSSECGISSKDVVLETFIPSEWECCAVLSPIPSEYECCAVLSPVVWFRSVSGSIVMDLSPSDEPTLNPLRLRDASEFRSFPRRLLGSSPNTPEALLDSDELLDIFDGEDDMDEDEVADDEEADCDEADLVLCR